MTARKLLIVNADDFGLTPDVNQGIVEAHRRGILTATTLMTNGEAFDDAVRLARQVPSLDVGCHLVLVGGRSLMTGRPLPATVRLFLAALARREFSIADELTAQLRRMLDAGMRPTHLDTHKHTHLAPPVLDAVARIAEEFDVRWIRSPFDFPLPSGRIAVPPGKRLTSGALGLLRGRFRRVLARHHCRTTDFFTGFQVTDLLQTGQLVELLTAIRPGSTELMCHPGFCREPLRQARTRLKESRERELEALTAPEVLQTVERCGIELVNYAALAV
ncbi:MAG TPA: ChbG/HpnK family deacetylase [Bryobacteraceae bacterium]|nr:ChbG/HpnK family deacetylase [Bryobacteraceae bacterium]